MIFNKNKTRGVALIITMIILSTLIIIAVGVASIFANQIKTSGSVDDSIFAVMAADAAIEKKLYDIRKLGGSINTSYSATLSNNATYIACPIAGSCSGAVGDITIKSIGSFNGSQRSFEVTF